MFVFLPLLALAGSDPSVLDVYREACLDGQLQLTPERGELVEGARLPSVMYSDERFPEPNRVVYVRMKKPADTFVSIEQFDSPKAKFESICKVASTRWVERDARLAFIAGTTKPKVLDTRDGGHPYEPYIIDQPSNGIRKRLFVHEPWAVVETAVYRDTK
jgi:hypothetical protein